MVEISGSISTGVSLNGSLSNDTATSGEVVIGNQIDGQMIGGPKGEDGYTPVKGVDYFDDPNPNASRRNIKMAIVCYNNGKGIK